MAEKRSDVEYEIMDIADFKLPFLGEPGGDASGVAAWSQRVAGWLCFCCCRNIITPLRGH